MNLVFRPQQSYSIYRAENIITEYSLSYFRLITQSHYVILISSITISTLF